MKIKDIMISDVISVSPNASISEVADVIFSNRFHGIPVVEKNKIIGIITEDDFFLKDCDDLFLPAYIKFLKENKSAENLPKDVREKIKKISGIKAKDIMTENCVIVSPKMNTEEFMKLIKETKFSTFPVAEKDKTLLGIVTLSDILGTVKKGSREMSQSLERRGKKGKLYQLTSELNALWQDKIVLASRKRVQTWKGLAFLGLAALLLLIIALAFITKNQINYEEENTISVPLECQKYVYGSWSGCNEKEFKTREIMKRFPKNCSGGIIPELIMPCR